MESTVQRKRCVLEKEGSLPHVGQECAGALMLALFQLLYYTPDSVPLDT